MPGFLDRVVAARLMNEQGLRALVLVQPESIQYATGAFPGVATLWRRGGAAALLVPADPVVPMAAIVGDLEADGFRQVSGIEDVRSHPIWVETTATTLGGGDVVGAIAASNRHRSPGFTRPASFEPAIALALLRDAMAERGLDKGRIGLEFGFLPVADMPAFDKALPNVRWRDASPIVARLRMIKHPAEIRLLRLAADLTTAGLRHVLDNLAPGIDAAALAAQWSEAIDREALRRGVKEPVSSWAYIAVGPDGFAPGGPAQRRDIVKIDVGAVVSGYSADMARTAVIGRPTPDQRRVHAALLDAFEEGIAALEPGRPLREAHRAATAAMHRAGFVSYSRGHFGHSLGATLFNEEWPFISADSDVALEPGMVIAFETPYYIRGLGGFIIEDQFLVGETGLELMSPLPRALYEAPTG
jgi:Xaa-Pro dipeptidase